MTLLASVYIDTTAFSYVTARPSGNLVTAAHQRVTAEWWQTAAMKYRLFGSVVPLKGLMRDEASLCRRETARAGLVSARGLG